jgi:hypothetical protein
MIVYEGPGNVLHSDRQTLMCTTNVVGAMGAGVAKAFRDAYPELYAHYRSLFPVRKQTPNPMLARQLHVFPINDRQQCLLFPTKVHWRDPSPPGLVVDNLKALRRDYAKLGITSLAAVPTGCRNGQLPWPLVRRWLYLAFEDLPIEVDILTG